MLSFLLDNDLGTILLHFKMSDKQTEWIENCRRQFCKMMKAKPDIISGSGKCTNFCGFLFLYKNFINRSSVSWRLVPACLEYIILNSRSLWFLKMCDPGELKLKFEITKLFKKTV